MLPTPGSSPLLHVKEINAAGLSTLLAIAEDNPGAAAVLFGTSEDVVRRLLALQEREKPVRERIGYIDMLADSPAPLFEMGVSASYLHKAARAPVGDDWCSASGPYVKYRDLVRTLNRLLVRSLDRLSWHRVAAVLAFNLPQDVTDAFTEISDAEVVQVEDHAARPLIRLRITPKVLDQLFRFLSRPCIDASLARWILLCNTTAVEIDDLPHVEPCSAESLAGCAKKGRPEEIPFTKEVSDLCREIGMLGGTMMTACKLLGPGVNVVGLRRIIAAGREAGVTGGVGWDTNLVTRLMTTSIVLSSLRLQRAGYDFGAAQIYAYAYYKNYLVASGGPTIKLDDYVEKIASPLRRSTVWLGHTSQFDAAHLIIDDGVRCEVVPPHASLLDMGRIGDARNARRKMQIAA